MAVIQAICVSDERGTRKRAVAAATLVENHGIQGDAHAGDWHRQVSLLSADKVTAFRERGADVGNGDFGENLVVEGLDFRALPVGTLLAVGGALLEMTQIGKECHTHCAIYNQTGDCIMPREGVFAKVLRGGDIAVGDEMTIVPFEGKRPYQAAVITLSDRSSKGERADLSGPVIAERLTAAGLNVAAMVILPDERARLERTLIQFADQRQLDLVLTTGGTGFAPRDVTPEATLAVAERLAPGIAEAMRAYSLRITPKAMLSRGVSVIRGKTLIVNLPGSPKACGECLDCILETLPHAMDLLRDDVRDCGSK